jgi:P22 coat protein - gene protein 5
MPTNTFNKTSWVAMKGLSLLKNSLAIAPYFSDEYSGDYAQRFAIGKTMTVPLSQRYTVQRNDMTFTAQNLDRPTTTISIDQTATIALEWASIEQALDMERGEDRVEEIYLKPAIAYIRQEIESSAAAFAAQNANMIVGQLGTNPSTYDTTSGAALQYLTQMGCPVDDDNLGLFLPPAVNRSVKTSANAFTNPQLDISKQFRSGFIQKSDSFDWYASNSLYRHTAGTWAGAVTMSAAAPQSGSSINIVGTSGDTFKKGDKFSIANVNEVNLMTRTPNSTATAGTKTFSVMASVTAAGTSATLSIYPPIYGPGSHYQNVDALPASSAALTLWPGTTAPNGKIGKLGLGLYPGAFFIAGKKLDEPQKAEFARQYQDPKTGIPLRLIQDWDNRTSSLTTRFDTTWGFGVGLAEQCAVVIPCG